MITVASENIHIGRALKIMHGHTPEYKDRVIKILTALQEENYPLNMLLSGRHINHIQGSLHALSKIKLEILILLLRAGIIDHSEGLVRLLNSGHLLEHGNMHNLEYLIRWGLCKFTYKASSEVHSWEAPFERVRWSDDFYKLYNVACSPEDIDFDNVLVDTLPIGTNHTRSIGDCHLRDNRTSSIIKPLYSLAKDSEEWSKKFVFIRIQGVIVGHIKFIGVHSFFSYVNVVNGGTPVLLHGCFYDVDIRKAVEDIRHDFTKPEPVVMDFDTMEASLMESAKREKGHLPDLNNQLRNFLSKFDIPGIPKI